MTTTPAPTPTPGAQMTATILAAAESVLTPAIDGALAASGPVGVAAAGALAGLLPVLLQASTPPTTDAVAALAAALSQFEADIAATPDPPKPA